MVKGRGRHSLFFKLFAILLFTGLLTHLVVGGFYRHFRHAGGREAADRNLRHYADLLTQEIGAPPDTVLALRLAGEMNLSIAIQGPGWSWASPGVSEGVWERLRSRVPGDSTRLHARPGHLIAVAARNRYLFVFESRLRHPMESRAWDWIAFLGILSLVWMIAWLALRHLLLPVRALAQGVAAVQAGDLDVRISERGRDELAELARSFNAMTESLKERLRARDQLLLDVSHELRSPLTRMRVQLEMSAPGSATDGLREEVDALEKMVRELLETERLRSGAGGLRRECLDLAHLCLEVLGGFPEPPGLSWRGPNVPIVAWVDAERIKLVLRNLIENALKHGGSAARPVEVSLSSGGGAEFALIAVRDFGPGIPEEEQRLVFEPFYRVDRSRSRMPGYGLGLSLCRRIIEAHGGTIALESKVGEGTTVTVRLPLASVRP